MAKAQGWMQHLDLLKSTTDNPNCHFCEKRGIQHDTNAVSAHQQEVHPGQIEPPSIPPPGNNLPCLFLGMTCSSVYFSLKNFENWYSHSLTHFRNKEPPSRSSCIFCDKFNNDSSFESWPARMNHIAEHFSSGDKLADSRPDFKVLKYLNENGGLSNEDYEYCLKYTERPDIDGLKPHDWVPEDKMMERKAEEDRLNRIPTHESRNEMRERAAQEKRRKMEKATSSQNK